MTSIKAKLVALLTAITTYALPVSDASAHYGFRGWV
jgi:hypothetical protein